METLSICVPAYNAERTLAATLQSILRTDDEFELVVLDNASTDKTRAIAESFDDPRIRVHANDDMLPIGANWNRAVRLSTGKLVKVVCADDVLLPGALTAQLKIMSDRSIALSSGRYQVIDAEDVIVESGLGICGLEGRREGRDLMRAIVRGGPMQFGPTAAAMFRRSHFDLVGGIRGDLIFPMDVDLFARVGAFGAFFGMPTVLAAWRTSPFNLCSRTSTVSKLSEMFRFHHRLAADYPQVVRQRDALAGDRRLARAAMERLRVRMATGVWHPSGGPR
ncbi:glycosyltransferase family 2 protein [Nocardia sp. NPDC052566]|uniref:glycosyltransferase family 2 protein n=1 Tax=Nocardia sp. NPDC052566 TaxID=3364330 RepID=UPI0037CBC86D